MRYAVSARAFLFVWLLIGSSAVTAADAASPALSDEELLTVVRRAVKARESALLEDGVRGTFELGQTNPGEINEKLPDGPVVRARTGITAGDSRSRVGLVASGRKWRFNLALTESQEMPVAAAGATTIEIASDGAQYTELNRLTGQGAINHTHLMASGSDVWLNMEVPTEYWLTIDSRPISEIMADPRIAVSVLHGSDARDGFITLKLSYSDRGPATLSLNAERAYLVEAADRYYAENLVWRTYRMSDAENLGDDLWVPKTWKIERYGVRGDKSVKMNLPREWSLISMTPHARPSDDEFRVKFPPGTLVADNTKGTAHQAGIDDNEEYPDTAKWAKARQLPLNSIKTDAERVKWSYVFVAVNAVVLALISGLAWWRFRRRNAHQVGKAG